MTGIRAHCTPLFVATTTTTATKTAKKEQQQPTSKNQHDSYLCNITSPKKPWTSFTSCVTFNLQPPTFFFGFFFGGPLTGVPCAVPCLPGLRLGVVSAVGGPDYVAALKSIKATWSEAIVLLAGPSATSVPVSADWAKAAEAWRGTTHGTTRMGLKG